MRYHLTTLGCPKNVADSERLVRELRGHVPVAEPDDADVLIVNTCGFIDAAKRESIDAILRLAAERRPEQRLVVAGCLTALWREDLQREIPEVDATFGVEAWDAIASYVDALEPEGRRARYHLPEPTVAYGPSAYLKIADGCNAPCTFCVIPKMKGFLHSRPMDDLVAEARRLAEAGVREIVLVAQDTTDYGRDLGLRDALPDLLERLVEAAPGVRWFRVMYAYPGHVSERLARVMASLPQVCRYIDIPLQHGSPSVLRRMKRPSNLARVREMLDMLRSSMPDIAIRTTFITGFPGETEAEFEELLAFVREQRFDRVGAFTFSPQPFTHAATMPGQIPERVKRQRRDRLMRLAAEISAERQAEQVGRELDVLVERRRADGTLIGRTYRDAPEVDGVMYVRGDAAPGDVVRVRVTTSGTYDLSGDIVVPAAQGQRT
ncbi:MAG TPA: 30S ribosomal protein S12 methylthiotransferase RimO [Dehalococcoidia bacterium]|nr:30S ribosomal protein S12 methylthiotransferase RimO [Dehalococcoidia bacterium]